MAEEISLEFRLRKIDETRNYLLDEIKDNQVISVSTVTGCIPISAFASLVCVLVGITNSAVGLKICAITAGTKRYQSIVKKKKKKHGKIVLLGKDKLNTIEVLISKVFN